jgi:hypothetical protein
MALTGLARKVLTRVKGTPPTQLRRIVPSESHR